MKKTKLELYRSRSGLVIINRESLRSYDCNKKTESEEFNNLFNLFDRVPKSAGDSVMINLLS